MHNHETGNYINEISEFYQMLYYVNQATTKLNLWLAVLPRLNYVALVVARRLVSKQKYHLLT